MNHLVILHVEEWEALYVNDEMVFEHHEVEIRTIAPYVPIQTLVKVYVNDDSPLGKYVTEHGGFPVHFSDCIHLQHSLQRHTPVSNV